MQAGAIAGLSPGLTTGSISMGFGVGRNQSLTIPGGSGRPATVADTQPGPYNGPGSGMAFLGEPLAVWIGGILFLFLLKFLMEKPGVKVLGENVNPAYIRIGGVNFMIIGVVASLWIVINKVLWNYFKVPGLTEYSNAA